MTREDIERSFQYNMTDAFIKWDKAVNAEYKEENEDAFYQGAYAAQKYLIEKAYEWLKLNLGNPKNAHPILVNHLIDNFRKAMEE